MFTKTLKYTSAVTLPAAIGISVFGPLLMEALYGSRWEGIEEPLRVLAIYAGIRSLSSVIHDLYKAAGHPEIFQRVVLFKLVAIASLGIPAVRAYGVLGMAALIVVTYVCALLWEIRELTRILKIAMSGVLRVILAPIALSLTVTMSVYWASTRLSSMDAAWQVVAAMGIVAVVYGGLFYVTDREAAEDLRALRTRKHEPDPSAETVPAQ